MTEPHRITIEPNPHRVTVTFDGKTVVDTRHGLILREQGLPPVHYLPRADANLDYLARTDTHTHCPFKGEASYFSLVSPTRTATDAVWTYETPKDGVTEITGHLAFYPDQVTITETE